MKKLLVGLLSLSFTLQINSMEIEYDTPPPSTVTGRNWTPKEYELWVQENPKEKQLFDAINDGSISQVQQLLEQGAKVNKKSWFHETALQHAVRLGKIPICKLLRSYGADTNYKPVAEHEEDKPLWSLAVQIGNTELFELLYDQKKVVTLLCCLRQMKKEKNLFATVFYNNAGHFIKPYFINHFRSINEKVYGQTALMREAWAGNLEICQLLIEHGADVNIQCQYGPNSKPQTALSLVKQKLGETYAWFNYRGHYCYDLALDVRAKQKQFEEIRDLLLAHGAL